MERETQKLRVLKILFRRTARFGKDTWHFPYDFEDSDGEFVGYKAPTRFVELCNEYPALIETKLDGKYRVGRLKVGNLKEGIESLPKKYHRPLLEEASKLGIKYPHVVERVVIDPVTRVARLIREEIK